MKRVLEFIKQLPDTSKAEAYGVFPKSINQVNDSWLFMIKDGERYLVVCGNLRSKFQGEEYKYADTAFLVAPLNHVNAIALREVLPFTAPRRVLKEERSIGLGDRLGIATIGHIHAFEGYDAYPVFAQQSIRELTLTERTFADVLDCVTFNVFEEGYKKGFGADGDHLKKESELEYALSTGYTMITLDCSEHIRSDVGLSFGEIKEKVKLTNELKERYLNRVFEIEGHELVFTEEDLLRCEYIYGDALQFAIKIYQKYLQDGKADFEISIDETSTPTTPLQHYFVANELSYAKVDITTLAPRFCGEFQKGVDYIGDLKQFEQELIVHCAISRYFGYKLSIHSGSDKFSTFPFIGKYTKGRFHVKTAGTSWLEAMKVVAMCDPSLYREVHKFALAKFNDATKYYHVTTNINNIPNVDTLKDEELVSLFKNNDARQLIHITYGFILTTKDTNDKYLFKDRLYQLWDKELAEYNLALKNHIGHHLELLYQGFGGKK